MRRREFILGAAGALGASRLRLWADHHVVTADPAVIEFDLSSLEGRYTRVEDFYVRSHFSAPEPLASYSLQIDGEVDEPQSFSLDRLIRLNEHSVGMVLECAGAPVATVSLISDGVFRGCLLHDVVALARPRTTARFLHCFGGDRFSRSVPFEQAMDGGLLATTLNDQPLKRNHGAPLRVVFPGWYGMNAVKWLRRIAVANSPLPDIDDTYLELRRGSEGEVVNTSLPRIKVRSIITSPLNDAVLPRGRVVVRGLAWSGEGRPASVEVCAGAGSRWVAAKLDQSGGRYDWAPWQAVLQIDQPGLTEFACRATDESGHTQPATREPGRLDSYSNNNYHRIKCVVVPGSAS